MLFLLLVFSKKGECKNYFHNPYIPYIPDFLFYVKKKKKCFFRGGDFILDETNFIL